MEKLVFSVLAGRCERHPFEGLLGDLKHQMASFLCSKGCGRPLGKWQRGRTIDFGFLHQLGNFLEDPDFRAMEEMVNGVRIGAVWPALSRELILFGRQSPSGNLGSSAWTRFQN